MKRIIEMPYSDSTVFVAVDVPETEQLTERVRGISEKETVMGFPIRKVEKDYTEIDEMIVKYAKPIVKSFEELSKEIISPTKAKASFGLEIDFTGKIILAQGTLKTSVNVEIEWDLSNNKNNKNNNKNKADTN